MYKNSKGFSLTETLVAFSCTLVICGLFIPFLIQYMHRLQQLQYEVEALKFLRESVEKAIVTHEFSTHARMYKGVRYEVAWKDGSGDEACVRYDSREICTSQKR